MEKFVTILKNHHLDKVDPDIDWCVKYGDGFVLGYSRNVLGVEGKWEAYQEYKVALISDTGRLVWSMISEWRR